MAQNGKGFSFGGDLWQTNEFRPWTVAICAKDKRGRVWKGIFSRCRRKFAQQQAAYQELFLLNESTVLIEQHITSRSGFGYGEKCQICPNTSSLFKTLQMLILWWITAVFVCINQIVLKDNRVI